MNRTALKSEDLLHLAASHVPGFTAEGPPQRLRGGLLNHVWRLPARPEPIIAKQAPSRMASSPDVVLDPSRLRFEARALTDVNEGGRLQELASEELRPPRPRAFVPSVPILFMEDIGDGPDLQAWLYANPGVRRARSAGAQLGAWMARLHAATAARDDFARDYDNRPIQETRRRVQYEAVAAAWEAQAEVNLRRLAPAARRLGQLLLRPGRCLVMGDLWPRSIRFAPRERIRLIDWEFAHYGRPLQDTAHLEAHLWMLAHRAPTPEVRACVDTFARAFEQSYTGLIQDRAPGLFDAEERYFHRIHVACELFVRAVGPFKGGYLYDGLEEQSGPVQEVLFAITEYAGA